MKVEDIIKEFKRQIAALYGERLKKIILYGSYARKDETPDSDIDLAVVVEGQIIPGREIDRMIDVITDINFKYDVLLSIYPVSEKNYNTIKSPILLNIRKEGIPV